MIYDIQQRMMYEIIKPFEGHAIETDRGSAVRESRWRQDSMLCY